MPPFRFRLEQVLRYRKQLEEEAMQALAAAVMQRDALLERIGSLERAMAEERTRLSRAENLSGAERRLSLDYAKALKLDMAACRKRLSAAENEVDRCRTELVQKAKDRGLLDSLKEKQAERHLQLERQQEQRTNDETATLRYKPAAV